ncbi:MAG: tRNA (adenosine(37)-N6)-threonylcarbamoyltransferase complex dimerization subunit type 1 TsaB [Clostridia bacterium]
MKFLAIDTTAEKLTVVLNVEGKMTFSDIETGKTGHSKILLPTISTLLDSQKVDVKELDAIAVVVGPGSFTGIRIGVSAVTAICFATGAKRISVTSFEMLAYSREKVAVSVDAGHGNLYVAKCENGKVLSTDFIATEDAVKLDRSAYVVEPIVSSAVALNAVVERKINEGEYVGVFEPFYMRKSQAERTKDEN